MITMLEVLFKKQYNKALEFTVHGKPFPIMFNYASNLLM